MSIKHETLPFYSTNFIKEYLKIDIEKSLRYKFYTFGVLLINISNMEEIVSNHSELTKERIFTDIYFVLRSNIRRSDVYGFWDDSSILISFSFIKEDTFNIIEKRLRDALYSFPFKSYDNIKIDLKLEFKSLFFDPEKTDKDKFLSELNEFAKREIKENSFDSTLLEKVDNLEDNNIDIAYQPIYSIYNNAVFGYEAFLKLFDEEKYSISLRSLLPKLSDAKKYTIEKIAIKKALNDFYKTFFLKKKTNLVLFINVSISSIYKENILDYLLSLVKELGMSQDKIVIEINENDIIEHLYLIDEIAKKIKESSFSLSIDDFGSAFEPLTYLAKLSPSYVKLNNNLFFASMSDNYKKLKLSSLIAISKDIGAKTVSKAIENESFYRFAKDMGIDLAQGYYLGSPTKELQLSQIDIDKISVYYQEVFELKEKKEIGSDIKFQFYRKNEIIFPLRFLSLGLNYDLDLFILRALKELRYKKGFDENRFIFVQLYSFSEDIIKELSNLFGKRLCVYVPLSLGTLEIINTYKILKKYDISLALFFDSSKVLEEEILNLKFDFVAISFNSIKLYDNVKEFFANFLNILSRFGYDKLIVKDVDDQEDADIINPFEKENKQFINYAQGLFFSKPKKLLEIKL